MQVTRCFLSEKTKIELLFEEVLNHILKLRITI